MIQTIIGIVVRLQSSLKNKFIKKNQKENSKETYVFVMKDYEVAIIPHRQKQLFN